MATYAEFINNKKKKKKDEGGTSFEDFSRSRLGASASAGGSANPAGTEDKKWYQEFFQKSEGNFLQSAGGTVADVGVNVLKGAGRVVEGVGDLAVYGAAGVNDLFGGSDRVTSNIKKFAQKSIVDEASKVVDDYLDDYSVLGKTSDSLTEGLGQVATLILTGGIAGAARAGSAGATAITTGLMGASSMGSGIGEAYEGGATDEEAVRYGVTKGAIDAVSELIFGGLGKAANALGYSKGLSSLDDAFAKKLGSILTKNIKKEGVKNAVGNTAEFLVKSGAEGLEEVIAGYFTAHAKKGTFQSEEDFNKILADESLLEQFVLGALTSVISQSGIVPGMHRGSLIDSTRKGQDFVTGLNSNETAVVDKLYKDETSKEEEGGKKLTEKEKNKIHEQIIALLDRGELSTDDIESVLGGDEYKAYKDASNKVESLKKQKESLQTEFNNLNKMKVGERTGEQTDRLEELRSQIKDIDQQIANPQNDAEIKKLKSHVSKKVAELTKNDRLGESYREAERRGQRYTADTSKKYNEKQQTIVNKAIESGILNNTRKAHDLVDMIAKLYDDKDVDFDFVNNENLKNSSYAVNGKYVNGYYDGKLKKIGINVNSKKYLNTVVGHEITHVLEGTEAYNALQKSVVEYAKKKGDYNRKLEEIKALYDEKDVDSELTADLVGDYIFSDPDFVTNLYAKDRNLFQKIWDEIKYLYKIATAGSKEARELERVKKAFEDAYREGGVNKNTTAEDGVSHSFSSIANTFYGDENMSAVAFKEGDYKQTEGYKTYVEQCINNLRQSTKDFDETSARADVEKSIDGIVQVALAAKRAGYDILDDSKKRNKKDSRDRLLFSSLEPNSDYFTSSDISTICDKRKNFAEIYDDIVRAEEAKGVPEDKRFFKNVDNYFYLHKLMADKGLTQPCRQCYVESMRKNLAPMADAFLRLVRETDSNNTANDQLYEQKGKNKGKLKSNNAATREWVIDKLADYGESANSLTVEMLSTAEGLAKLKIQMPLIYEAFNSFYGQSKPKMPKSATPFRFGELTALLTDHNGKINERLVNKINSTGGFRLQSYSDFQIQNYADVLQTIFEAGTLGLNGHAYTKVPAFLEATKNTNLKRNISIFMYKDGDQWRLDRNDSFPYTLEEIYDIVSSDESGNTGIIAVSQNKEMSAWIMANDFIGYGIPFHKSGLKMAVVRDTIVKEDGREIRGYTGTIDHTKQQTEVWAKTTEDHKAFTKVKNGINIYSFWDFKNVDGLSKNQLIEKNVKAYIDACEEAGYIPKFRDYVTNNEKVLNDVLRYSKELGMVGLDANIDDISFKYKGYTIPYGYYKFLGDFSMFTPDGDAAPQQKLSLKDYDFDEAVKFFKDSETLRRNEILQQFANGEERQKYRESNMTAEQLQEVIKQKRGEIAQDVVNGKVKPSLSSEDKFTVRADGYGITSEDVRFRENAFDGFMEETETAPEADNVVMDAEDDEKSSETEYPIFTTGQKLNEKKRNYQEELDRNVQLREESNASYDQKIADAQARYDAIKDKSTKAANTLARRIERLKRLKGNNDADFEKRINDLNSRIAKTEEESVEKIKAYKTAVQARAKNKEYTDLAEEMVGDTSTWVDKKLGISYKINTLRRNLRDIVRDANGNRDIAKADAITDEYQGNYSDHEAEKNREATRIKKPYADMKVTKAEDAYIQMLGEFRHNPDTTLTEDVVKTYYEKHKDKIDIDKVDKAIEMVRKTYDDLFERVNNRLREQGMKEIPYRKGYFPHFTEDKQGFLAKLLNWKVQNNEIPTSIAGLTEQFKPNRSWQSFSKQRKTDVTDYSFTKGLDTYVEGALDWIYHIEDIQKRRALENYIRYSRSDKGVQEKIDAIRKNETYDAEEMQEQIDLVYKEANNPLNNFVTDLRAGTNRLANKKSSMDRGMEEALNRKIYSVMTNVSNRFSANAVAGNIASALSNFIPLTQLVGTVPLKTVARATADVTQSYRSDDGVVDKSTFLTNRLRKADNLYKSGWDKVSDTLGLAFEGIDDFSSQVVWRSKYLDNLSHGMSEAEAIKNADQFAAGLMADRSKGNIPTLFEAKNPIVKLFTAFQLEVSNQYGYMFKDMPNDIGKKSKRNLVKAYFGMFTAAFLYNELTSMLTGRYAAFDPVRILKDLFDDLLDDDEEEPLENFLDAAEGFGKDVAEEIPFVGGMLGGGRVPISSALPDWEGLWNAFSEEDTTARAKKIANALDGTFYYGVLPMAGGQIKKTVEGLSMFDEDNPVAGSYTDSGKLRYSVDDNIGNRIKAALFGQYANKNAMDYFEEERSPLSEKQTQELADMDIPIQEYWEYQDSGKTSGGGRSSEKKTTNGSISNLEEFTFSKNNPEEYALSKAISRDFSEYNRYMEDLNAITDEDEEIRKEKVVDYINNLDAEYGEKIVLYKSIFKDDNSYNMDIVNLLNRRYNLSYDDIKSVLETLDFDVDDEGNITWKE